MPFLSKSELRNLIGNGKTQQVINDLLEITKSLEDNELHNEVVLQSSKFKKYQKRGRKGISTFENQNISISRIKVALLQIIDDLPNDLKKISTEIEDKQKKKSIWTYVALWAALLAVLLVIAILIRFIFTENHQHKSDLTAIPKNFEPSSNSIFKANNKDTFNVLIVRFEDYIVGEDTYCIGRAVEEHLNVIDVNENLSLPLKNVYVADSILPPKSQQEAIAIQKRHHSDLIIYGLARQVEQNCAGAEVCFRYKIAENVIANVAPENKVKAAKHDAEYQQTSPIEIEDGKLQIDSLSIKYWISSLVNAKANKIEETFADLTDLATKDIELLSDSEKAKWYFNVGKTYTKLKKYQKAISNYQKAIQLNPDDAKAYNNRGVAYHNLKEYLKAIGDYDKAIQLDPVNAKAFYNRGITYYNLKEYQKAIDDYDKAIQLNPNYSRAYIARGNTYHILKIYFKVIEDYDKGIQLNPDDSYLYNNRGIAYGNLGDYQKAIVDYDKAIQLGSDNVFAYFNRGNAYHNLKDYQKAINDYNKVIQLDPDDAEAYSNRGIAYRNLGDYQKAIADFDKAIKLNPDDADAYNNLGYALLYQEKLPLTKKNLEKSKALDPNNSWVYRNLACYYALQNHEELALQNLEKAIQLGYDDVEWLEEESCLASIRQLQRFRQLVSSILKEK